MPGEPPRSGRRVDEGAGADAAGEKPLGDETDVRRGDGVARDLEAAGELSRRRQGHAGAEAPVHHGDAELPVDLPGEIVAPGERDMELHRVMVIGSSDFVNIGSCEDPLQGYDFSMKERISFDASPKPGEIMESLERYLAASGLDRGLLELVKYRVSMMNGCAYCLDMHWKDARARDESEQRLYGLGAWREAPYYTDRERAAFAWAEAVTRLDVGHVPDDVYDEARRHFGEKELADLTYGVCAINTWNRLCVAFRTPAGNYKAKRSG
jgi:AhpD family alkylhydroperoxidase